MGSARVRRLVARLLRCAERGAVIGFLSLPLACGQLGLSQHPWEQPAPPLKVGPVVDASALTRAELPNGLRVLILEDHRRPMVSLSLVVARGAGAVTPAQAGAAEFLAELMSRGAGGRDALEIAEMVDELGASLSVSAGWDSMAVSVDGLSRDLPQLLDIVTDVARTPRLEASEAAKTREEQLAAIAAAKDNPGALANWQAMRVLYPDHRYGRPVLGTPETVARLDADVARELHSRYFVPGNAILAISGDVDSKQILKRVREKYGDWKKAPLPSMTPPTPATTPPARRIVIADRPDLVQSRILIVQEGIDRTDPRRIPANLLNDTLGGSGFASRLMKKLRSEEGLTYGVRSMFALRRQPGPFVVSTFTRVPETRRAVDILLTQIEAIRSTRPQSSSELTKAKSYSVGQFGLGLETSAAVLSSLVDLEVYGLPDDLLDTYRSRVDAVTDAETSRVAKELLHPSRAAIVLLGPASVLEPQFKDLGPVEVVPAEQEGAPASS